MTFPDYLRILRTFAGFIVTCAIAGGLVALAFVSLPATEYRARFAVDARSQYRRPRQRTET